MGAATEHSRNGTAVGCHTHVRQATCQPKSSRFLTSRYGVGAGDSPGEGEGASTEPRVLDGFLLAELELFFFDGVGDAAVVAGAVVVVPCCCVQESINATPVKEVIKTKTYFFIGNLRFAPHRTFGCQLDSDNRLF